MSAGTGAASGASRWVDVTYPTAPGPRALGDAIPTAGPWWDEGEGVPGAGGNRREGRWEKERSMR